MSTKYMATTRSGDVVRRTSNRVYTHAVVYRNRGARTWEASWCGSHALATKEYRRLTMYLPRFEPESLQIIEAAKS